VAGAPLKAMSLTFIERAGLPHRCPIHDTERVEGHCTCGATLVDDARFCHRCGRPVREDDPLLLPPEPDEETIAEESASDSGAQDESIQAAVPPADVSFRSPLAVRTGFLAASLVQLAIMLIAMVHMVQLLPIVLAAGGAYAVVLFCRRSGRILSVTEGARMGWIAGVFGFVISTVLFTAGLVASGRGFVSLIQENLKAAQLDSEATTRALELIGTPQILAVFIVLMLLFNFLLVAVVSSLGGALGARLTRRG